MRKKIRLKLFLKKSVLGLALVLSFAAQAYDPIRDPEKLRLPAEKPTENVLKVSTARVLIADYVLIKKDFPLLQNKTDDEIDQWILDQAGYMAETQVAQTDLNTQIKVAEKTKAGYRPVHYGRALVYPVDGGGLIDIKGVGARQPRQASHASGLMTTGEAIREFSFEKLVNGIFKNEGGNFDTVGTYAVIDWGFDMKYKDKARIPAGALLRQAHDRYGDPDSGDRNDYNFLPAEKAMDIELLLRRYGVTSAGTCNDHADIADLQGTSSCAVVDFGTFLVDTKFINAVQTIVEPVIIVEPDSDTFVQPDPKVRVNFSRWGHSGDRKSTHDLPWWGGEQLARLLKEKKMTIPQIRLFLNELIGGEFLKWRPFKRFYHSGENAHANFPASKRALELICLPAQPFLN